MSESNQDTRRDEQQEHFTQAHIDIAVLKENIKSLGKEQAETTAAIKGLSLRVGEMNALFAEAKGGWKVIAAVAGLASAMGGAVACMAGLQLNFQRNL